MCVKAIHGLRTPNYDLKSRVERTSEQRERRATDADFRLPICDFGLNRKSKIGNQEFKWWAGAAYQPLVPPYDAGRLNDTGENPSRRCLKGRDGNE